MFGFTRVLRLQFSCDVCLVGPQATQAPEGSPAGSSRALAGVSERMPQRGSALVASFRGTSVWRPQ